MATSRTPRHRDFRPPITPEMVRMWRRLNEILSHGDEDFWEDEGGARREYLDTGKRLAILCSLDWALMIWPTDALTAKVPPSLRNRPLQAAAHEAAYAARCALIAAAGEPGAG
jgi:hypothetical protein